MLVLKVIMCVFHGVIFLAGAAILGVGIWVTVDSSSLFDLLDHIKDAPPELAQLANVGYLLIAVGVLLTIMGLLGSVAAITENKCLLLTFFILVLLMFIAEVSGAIVILVFQTLVNTLLQKLNAEIVQTIQTKYDKDEGFTNLMNETMKQLKCCGYNNYTDFIDSPFYNATDSGYPAACCSESSATCNSTQVEETPVRGCFHALVKLLKDNAPVLGGVALGITALEFAVMVISLILYWNVGKEYRSITPSMTFAPPT